MPVFRQYPRTQQRSTHLLPVPLAVPSADFSFFDHFPGSSLDARWSTSTTGSGAITVTDSYVQSNVPADADAALVYYATKLDKTKSQLWQIAVSHHSSGANLDILQIWNKATAPAINTFATIDPFWRIRVGRSTSGTTGLAFHKYDSSHTRTTWTGYTTNAWQSPSTLAVPEMAVDDYYVVGFEIDGPGARWRLMSWHRDAPSSSFTQDQGYKLFSMTDWVAWSSMEATTDLWLVLGEPLTDFQAGTIRYEWVRVFGTDTKIHAWCNGNGPGNDYSLIKHHWSYDGYTFVPQDRDTVAVTVGTSGAWDDSKAKDRTVVKDGDTYYMVYSAEKVSTGLWELGVATATSPDGPWTKHGGNPILTSTGAGTSEEFLWTPYLIKDEAETDADKRWKLFYDGIDVSPVAHTIRLATAPSPTGTWTKQGICLDVGGGGAIDELGCSNPVVFWGDGAWEIWFTALAAGGGPRWSVCRATTTDLNSLPYTKDSGNNPYIPRDQDARQALTANLDGRTASMSDTTGFEVDQYVSARDSGGGGAAHLQWGYSRVRKVNTNTSLELYHGLSGFTTANSAAVREMNGGSITVHHIEYKNGRWNFYCTLFDIFRSDATLAGDFSETTGLCYSTNLTDKPKIWDWINSPNISQTPWDHRDSAENISVARLPILRAVNTGIASGEAFGTATVSLGAAVISPSGIATAEALGTAQLNLSIATSGIATAEAFGTATLHQFISTTGIASAEAFGTATLTTGAVTVSPSGIASAEAFGSAQLNLNLAASGIASAEAFGTPQLNLSLALSGIASAEAFGSTVVDSGAGLMDGLIGYWPLDETSGNREAIFEGGGDDLTLVDNNTVASAAGKLSNAADFDSASSEYLSLADNASMSVGDIDFTLACWVNFDALTTTRRLFTKGSGLSTGQYAFNCRWTAISSRLRFSVSAAGSFADVDANNLGAVSTGTWYFVVVWHDAGANTINIQVNNGTADSTGFSAGSQDEGGSFFVGQNSTGGEFLDGKMDALMFWKRVLSADERTFLYNSGNANSPIDPTTVTAQAIASAEAFGSHTVSTTAGAQNVEPSSIASAEAFGTASVNLSVSATGIASAEACGTAALNLNIVTTGIATGEAFGTATLTPGAVTITTTGIASEEVFGSHIVSQGGVILAPSGIASAEAFGSHTVAPGAVTITGNGIASAEAFGTATITTGAVTITTSGIATAEAFGTPALTTGAVTITANGIATAEAFGSHVVTAGGSLIVASGIASEEAFGTPSIAVGAVTVIANGIGSAEVFGSPSITTTVTVSPSGIATAEAFGAPVVTLGVITISPTGIASAQAFGVPTIIGGDVPTQITCALTVSQLNFCAITISQKYQCVITIAPGESMPYVLGNILPLKAEFKNQAGAFADPGEIKCIIKSPLGVKTEYTYLTDAQLVREDTGKYRVDFQPDKQGTWTTRFEGNVSNQAADEASFLMVESSFD